MIQNKKDIILLMADDDEDDRLMTSDALEDLDMDSCCIIKFAKDGVELLEYLNHTGKFSDHISSPSPDLILLDLNMPRMDGREALKTIKSDSNFKRIPIIVLTTSKAEEDVIRTYNLGVNSFIVKPTTYDALVEHMKIIINYWFNIVNLPLKNI